MTDTIESLLAEAIKAEETLKRLHPSDPAYRIYKANIDFYLTEALKLEAGGTNDSQTR